MQLVKESLVPEIGNLAKDLKFLEYVDKEFGEGYSEDIHEPDDINQGYCILAAKYLKKKYPEAEFYTLGNPLSYHVVLKIGNKYYDSVDTQGVFDITDLKWVEGWSDVKINPGIAYDC